MWDTFKGLMQEAWADKFCRGLTIVMIVFLFAVAVFLVYQAF